MSNATHLRGIKIPKTPPGNAQSLLYNPTTKEFYWGSGGGGGSASWGGITGTLSDQTDLNSALAGKAASSHTQTASTITDFAEAVDDRVNSLLVAGTNITLTYDDTANTLTVAASGGGGGSYTDEQAQDAVGTILVDSTSIDFTYNDAANTITASAIFGTTSGTVAEGSDSRFTDQRVPTDGSVTDAKIGNRTVDQALATPGNTGTLTSLLSWIAGRLKAITGKTNWYDAPDTTLATASTHINSTSNPHSTTAAQVGADPTGTASAAITTHVGLSNPHTQYALSSSLGNSSTRNVGTTTGTVAAGDDSRFTDPVQALGSVSGSTAITVTDSGATATIAGSTTFTFSGTVSSSNVKGFLLQLTNGGAFAITWPASVKWPGGVAPVLTASGVDFIMLVTIDGGTNWRGSLQARDSR